MFIDSFNDIRKQQISSWLLMVNKISFFIFFTPIMTYYHNSVIKIIQIGQWRKEGNVLFNDALNTFHLWLFGIRHMVKDHSDSERENPLLPYGLLFPINSKGSFICIIPQTG